MVYAAEADIIAPTVTAEDPERFFREKVAHVGYFMENAAAIFRAGALSENKVHDSFAAFF